MLLGTVALLALATAPAVAQQKTVKIGFVSTFSGGGGDQQRHAKLVQLS
jgi:ABC-type sugar transport system substrate-binding protein